LIRAAGGLRAGGAAVSRFRPVSRFTVTLKDAFKYAVSPHQLGMRFWPNSGSGSILMLGLRPAARKVGVGSRS
jgi:hypothetical protein